MTKSSSSSSSIVAKDVFDSRRLLSELKLDHLVLLSLACFDLKMTKLDNYEKKTKWAFTNVLLTVSVILTCTKASLEWYLFNRRESTIWKIFKKSVFFKRVRRTERGFAGRPHIFEVLFKFYKLYSQRFRQSNGLYHRIPISSGNVRWCFELNDI